MCITHYSRYAKVIIDIIHANVDREYTYSLPFPAEIGCHVLVTFGRANKAVEGFIIDITDSADCSHEIKEAVRLIEPYPIFTREQLLLAHWIKATYHSTLSQALRLMIPAQLRNSRVSEKEERTACISEGADIPAFLDTLTQKSGKLRAPKQYAVAKLLYESDAMMSVSDINAIIPGASAAITALHERGLVTISMRTVLRRPKYLSTPPEDLVLSDEQAGALNAILSKQGGVFLLHGVTGSGKTEIYMRVIEECLRAGKSAIVLVPEISLTPQTVARFSGRFAQNVAVLHSRLSSGERFDEWRRIRLGDVKVVVGARSAVFAPLESIGTIIIDEEHEDSYYSEQTPRYSAIQVAKKRCMLSNATLILGSATPSIASYHAAKSGKYTLLTLKSRVNALPMPTVEITDMRAEFAAGNNGVLGSLLKSRIAECIESNHQAILLMNRRGFSSFVSCKACGHVFFCPDCDVSLTYHKFDHTMKCHYCSKKLAIPKICPICNKPYIKYTGTGTQQVEDELKKSFPDIKCIRMDADTTGGKDAHEKLLREFADGNASVLLGTQMIAKGLDFKNVTLVGVISADALMAIPDFRSTERAFSLLTQVAGRAGRAASTGKVVIQTNAPQHPVTLLAARHDYEGFYDLTIKERMQFLYPPFTLFIRVLFTTDEEDVGEKESRAFADEIYKRLSAKIVESGGSVREILFLYAMSAPIKRIRNKYRHVVLMKLARNIRSGAMVNEVYSYAAEFTSQGLISVEVNPSDML